VKREVITAKTCLGCGACCVAPEQQEVFADVTHEDMKKMGSRLVRLHVLQPSFFTRMVAVISHRYSPSAIKTKTSEIRRGPLKGWVVTRCNALNGAPLKQVSCRIYSVRPEVCRKAVKPGDKACREIRRQIFQTIEDT